MRGQGVPRPTSDLDQKDRRPYFLWDEPMTVAELEQIVRGQDQKQRLYYMAKILREARYEDVWRFISVQDLTENWDELRPILGRKRNFWEFLLNKWKEHGLLP